MTRIIVKVSAPAIMSGPGFRNRVEPSNITESRDDKRANDGRMTSNKCK